MKQLIKLFVVLFAFASVSCVDKKEEQEVEEMVNEIEAVETKVDSISVEVEADAEALEEALDELEDDNI